MLLTFAFAACEANINVDDDNTSVNVGIGVGTLKVTSTSSNPYKIEIDGDYAGIINGHDTKTWKKNKGTYSVRVIQQSGYVLYPTDKNYVAVIKSNETTIITFP